MSDLSTPRRAVDAALAGWHATDQGGLYETFRAPDGVSGPMTWVQLETRGPLRPVVEMPTNDRERLHRILVAAKRQAGATVCAALFRVARACQEADGHTGRLIAGRPGSRESDRVGWLAWDVGSMISSGRYEEAELELVVATIKRWIFDPDRYVEVAENLAAVLAGVIDELGGYEKAADRWLRSHSQRWRIYSYLASGSTYFDPEAYQ